MTLTGPPNRSHQRDLNCLPYFGEYGINTHSPSLEASSSTRCPLEEGRYPAPSPVQPRALPYFNHKCVVHLHCTALLTCPANFASALPHKWLQCLFTPRGIFSRLARLTVSPTVSSSSGHVHADDLLSELALRGRLRVDDLFLFTHREEARPFGSPRGVLEN